MSIAKLKRDLVAPIAPLPPDVGQAGRLTGGDDLASPLAGELVSWSFVIEYHAMPNDPWGRSVAEHIREFLRHRGFAVTEPKLSILARKVPKAIATTNR